MEKIVLGGLIFNRLLVSSPRRKSREQRDKKTPGRKAPGSQTPTVVFKMGSHVDWPEIQLWMLFLVGTWLPFENSASPGRLLRTSTSFKGVLPRVWRVCFFLGPDAVQVLEINSESIRRGN